MSARDGRGRGATAGGTKKASAEKAAVKPAGAEGPDVGPPGAKRPDSERAGEPRASAARRNADASAAAAAADRDAAAQAPAPDDPGPLWRRLVMAVRGGIGELGEAIAESQALRILDQEIRDADAELARARTELGELRAHYKVALERQQAAAARVSEYEGYALKALKAEDEALAREVAARVAQLEQQRDAEAADAERHRLRVEAARKAIAQQESTMRRLRQQVDTVRATDNVQRAQATLAHRRLQAGGRAQTALQALERIRRRQAERGARLDAQAEPDEGDDALAEKLRHAGILGAGDDGADAVLARLKRRRRE